MAEPLRFLAVCLRKEFKRQTFVPHIKWEMVVFERDYQAIQKKLLTTWSLVRIQLPEPFYFLDNKRVVIYIKSHLQENVLGFPTVFPLWMEK